jgi:VacB/RNase II family 3'-5' exoribonuclease
MPKGYFDLGQSAYREMIQRGFHPDFPPEAMRQVAELRRAAPSTPADRDVRDMREVLWSSIDNDTSRDLDQIEFAEQTADGIRVCVGIADVDMNVPPGSPVDKHAREETTSVYTPTRTFAMLPEALSTDLTSLNPHEDRLAVVIEFVLSPEGDISKPEIYRARVRNQFQLTYSGVGEWLNGNRDAAGSVNQNGELATQLKLQDAAARLLREQRHKLGALVFERIETQPVLQDGMVEAVVARAPNRANDLIEDFMIAANEIMAETLTRAGIASLRRVVKSPARWPRIVEIAAGHGTKLPDDPDPRALSQFLEQQHRQDPDHYQDLSLSVLKLMGPGVYVVERPGEMNPGHFGLAAHDYTHSTAPNRRFADLVTQRLIKAVLPKASSPYSDDELEEIANNCTLKEDAARKVERAMNKRAAALAFSNHVGQQFRGIVTGAAAKGTWVRVMNPPMEGRVVSGEAGMDVGDHVTVKLVHTDPERGFIDFARAK